MLPNCFPMAPLVFSPADPGMGTMASAAEESADPMDVRAWQQGDSMKKVHWKLSARRREMLVRRFEEPALPEALVLLDCTRPEPGRHEACTRDALVETAASVMQAQADAANEIHLRLPGTVPGELTLRMGMDVIREQLSRLRFSDEAGFERQLLDASHQLRRIGATVVITSRLSSALVDLLGSMRKMGPTLRLCLVSDQADRPDWQPMLASMYQQEIEISMITPPKPQETDP